MEDGDEESVFLISIPAQTMWFKSLFEPKRQNWMIQKFWVKLGGKIRWLKGLGESKRRNWMIKKFG